MQADVTKIKQIKSALIRQLYKLDAETERRSSGFVERNLLKYCNATGHSGLIDTSGELFEWAQLRKEWLRLKLSEKPPQSLEDLRTLVDCILRNKLFENALPTDALVKPIIALENIHKLTILYEQPNAKIHPNISRECIRRLFQLATVEADALHAFLKSLKPYLK